jgi:hypothetical protein
MDAKKDTTDGFGWDAPINPADSNTEHKLLPEGPAMFTVTALKRDRKEFGKFGVQNVAVITLLVSTLVEDYDKDTYCDEAEVEVNLALIKQLQWKLLQFFTSIGQRKHGDEGLFTPNWGKVKDEVGRCMVAHRKFTGRKSGKEMTANDIKEFLAPDEAQGDDNLKF